MNNDDDNSNKPRFHDHLFHDHHHPSDLLPSHIIQSQPSIHDHDDLCSTLPEIVLFRSSSPDNSATPSSSDTDAAAAATNAVNSKGYAYINPEPHISSQFYTFNEKSHCLMIRCILEQRIATPDEIRAATPHSVLASWRSVWKDRNEETAYVTGWKRIQDKLTAYVDPNSGKEFLCFKNNSQQFVSHVNQWQDIVMSVHGDADLRHLGLRDTIDRIKQVWTVGAKLYGIPESFIRVCIAECHVCSSSEGSGSRNRRRRFEYTESFDVPAKEVPRRLQQLAVKHKVVLCIRQKYIRYKPFMAEVKDYACHRAGEPATKKSRTLKREPYASKRCGCGFRIRAIVPIMNYNEKDKSFVYQEEGMAVFKLYAVHSGHQPGPLDGNARIMHRIVGQKGGFLMDEEMVYGVHDDLENVGFGLIGNDEGELQHSVLQQVQELRTEIGMLEERLRKLPTELLGSVSQELFDTVNKVRSIGEDGSKMVGLHSHKPHQDDVLLGENDLVPWSDHHDAQIFVNGKETELIEDDEDSFGQIGSVVPWDHIRTECRNEKDLMSEPCKPEKWLKCNFDEKSILDCEDTKLTKPMRHDEPVVTEVGLLQVDSFYQENPKWYDSPCGLDPSADCGDNGFKPGEIV